MTPPTQSNAERIAALEKRVAWSLVMLCSGMAGLWVNQASAPWVMVVLNVGFWAVATAIHIASATKGRVP